MSTGSHTLALTGWVDVLRRVFRSTGMLFCIYGDSGAGIVDPFGVDSCVVCWIVQFCGTSCILCDAAARALCAAFPISRYVQRVSKGGLNFGQRALNAAMRWYRIAVKWGFGGTSNHFRCWSLLVFDPSAMTVCPSACCASCSCADSRTCASFHCDPYAELSFLELTLRLTCSGTTSFGNLSSLELPP